MLLKGGRRGKHCDTRSQGGLSGMEERLGLWCHPQEPTRDGSTGTRGPMPADNGPPGTRLAPQP